MPLMAGTISWAALNALSAQVNEVSSPQSWGVISEAWLPQQYQQGRERGVGVGSTASTVPGLPGKDTLAVGQGTLLGTQSQVGPIGRDHSGASGPTSLLQLGHPRACGTGLCPDSAAVTPVREIFGLPGQSHTLKNFHVQV